MAINVNGMLSVVCGNLGPVKGNLGGMEKQQFAIFIGKLLFFWQEEQTALFSNEFLIGFTVVSNKWSFYFQPLGGGVSLTVEWNKLYKNAYLIILVLKGGSRLGQFELILWFLFP